MIRVTKTKRQQLQRQCEQSALRSWGSHSMPRMSPDTQHPCRGRRRQAVVLRQTARTLMSHRGPGRRRDVNERRKRIPGCGCVEETPGRACEPCGHQGTQRGSPDRCCPLHAAGERAAAAAAAAAAAYLVFLLSDVGRARESEYLRSRLGSLFCGESHSVCCFVLRSES